MSHIVGNPTVVSDNGVSSRPSWCPRREPGLRGSPRVQGSVLDEARMRWAEIGWPKPEQLPRLHPTASRLSMTTGSLTGDGYDITSKNASTVEVESPFSYIMDGHEMTMTSAMLIVSPAFARSLLHSRQVAMSDR